MALPDYSRNLFGSKQFGDLSLVTIAIVNTARVAADSSPETTVSSAGSGVYNLTFPKATKGFPVAAPLVGVAGAAQAEFVAFDADAGTAQIDTGSDLSGGDACYVHLLLAFN